MTADNSGGFVRPVKGTPPPTCSKCHIYWLANQMGSRQPNEDWFYAEHDVGCVWWVLENV